MTKEKMNEEDGVWRTIGGRRVFIRNGQSLADAMKESGKFKNLQKTEKNKKDDYTKQEEERRKLVKELKEKLSEKDYKDLIDRSAKEEISNDEFKKILDKAKEEKNNDDYTKETDPEKRLKNVYMMDRVLRSMNNEEALDDGWLMNGVADGDSDYGYEKFKENSEMYDGKGYYYTSDEDYKNLVDMYKRRVKYAKDGLITDNKELVDFVKNDVESFPVYNDIHDDEVYDAKDGKVYTGMKSYKEEEARQIASNVKVDDTGEETIISGSGDELLAWTNSEEEATGVEIPRETKKMLEDNPDKQFQFRNEEYSFDEIENEMSNAETYEDLYNAADKIADPSLRKDATQCIEQCEEDGDSVDTAYSVTTTEYVDPYRNYENARVEEITDGGVLKDTAIKAYEDGDISYEELRDNYFDGDGQDVGEALTKANSERAKKELSMPESWTKYKEDSQIYKDWNKLTGKINDEVYYKNEELPEIVDNYLQKEGFTEDNGYSKEYIKNLKDNAVSSLHYTEYDKNELSNLGITDEDIKNAEEYSKTVNRRPWSEVKKEQDDYEYNLYKKAMNDPDSIDPMTENSTDWTRLNEKYRDRYKKENNSFKPRAKGAKSFEEHGVAFKDNATNERFSDYLRDTYGTDDIDIITTGSEKNAKDLRNEFNNKEYKQYVKDTLNNDDYLRENNPNAYMNKMIRDSKSSSKLKEKYKVSKSNDGKNEYIRTAHPYDETEYSYAWKDENNKWHVKDPTKKTASQNYQEHIYNSVDEAREKMNEIDTRISNDKSNSGKNYEGVSYNNYKKESVKEAKVDHTKEINNKDKFEVSELKSKAMQTLGEDYIDTNSFNSDLYIRKDEKSAKLINNLKNKDNGLLTTFKDDEGTEWYDIPFGNMQDDFKNRYSKGNSTTNQSIDDAYDEFDKKYSEAYERGKNSKVGSKEYKQALKDMNDAENEYAKKQKEISNNQTMNDAIRNSASKKSKKSFSDWTRVNKENNDRSQRYSGTISYLKDMGLTQSQIDAVLDRFMKDNKK